MAQVYQYGKAFANLLGGESSGDAFAVDFLTDTIKCALLQASHTPNLDSHETYDDVDADEVANGNGYTTGGVTLASKTITYTAANSWATARANSTAYALGDIVRPSTGNGHLYRCIVAGTSAGSAPTFPTVSGQTVTDGGVTWAEIGRGVTVVDCADPSWAAATIAAGYATIYKSTGTPNTSPLLFLVDFAGTFSSTNGTFQITIPTLGLVVFSTP